MAIGPDRVRLVKWEDASTGGDSADADPMGAPAPLDSSEDAIEVAGMYLHTGVEQDQTVGVYRQANELWAFDQSVPFPGVKLASLGGVGVPSHASTHAQGGSDELLIELLPSAIPYGYFPVTNGLGGVDMVLAPAPAFGTEVHTASSAPTSTTTSATFQNKLTLTTSALAGGTYILLFSATVAGTANNTVIEVQVLDGVTTLNSYQLRLSTANAEFSISGFAVLTKTGIQDFYINYRKSGGSGSASIKDARFTLWRIG